MFQGQIQLINPPPSLDQEKEKLLSVMKVTLKIATKRTKVIITSHACLTQQLFSQSLRKREFRPSHPVHMFQNRSNLKVGFCTKCQKYIALNSNTLQLALEQESKWLLMMGKNTLGLS